MKFHELPASWQAEVNKRSFRRSKEYDISMKEAEKSVLKELESAVKKDLRDKINQGKKGVHTT